MGCDIHMIVEKRVNGKWERVESLPPRPCSWCSAKGKYDSGLSCINCDGRTVDTEPYSERNYTVFATLAGVRSDGYVNPISEPRGLPEDATHGSEYEYGDHSFTWLTLAEVLNHDWKQPRDDEGWINAEAFQRWEASGKGCPGSWSASVGGGGVEHVSHKEMRRRITNPYPWEQGRMPYTLVQWSTPLADRCRPFLAFVESLTALGDPNDVRLVFGFDS